MLILSLVISNSSIKLNAHKIIKMQMSKKSFQNEKTNQLYLPKTENQKKYVNALNSNSSKIIIANGPAGTGKTLFACLKAIHLLNKEEITKIVITRPIIPVEEEEIGFLPGNMIKKMDPWTKPIFDLFLEYYSKSELDFLINKNSIEICPLAFMRGRTFKHSFIIADEMQNSSPNQMKMLTTRIGQNSKMVITGDLHQSDILKDNGLKDFMDKINRYNNSSNLINIIDLDNEDIERSEIVKKVIEIYNYKEVYNNKNPYNKGFYNNGDAALIPKAHISSHFDLYYENPQF
jgi:phosphate starvation-inducible PhoH-like protein